MSQALAQNDPMVGRTVAGRFVIQGRIGSGGMGTVYKAVQTGLNRPVALKLLKEEVSWDPDTITRFHREAKAMSLLGHANTVRVFDFGQTADGTLYLAMEYLEGDLLTRKIENDGGLPPIDAIKVVQQILGSLHEAHAKGIIHRDLKPDNIYLAEVDGTPDPVVKVLDFGIAKVFEGENTFDQLETQAGTVFGTPRYMSPEQAQGKTLDARSDIYSVGVLLYQLLTGLAPFRDEDAVVVMAKHIRDKPEPPNKVAPERRIPSSLNRAVLKALEKQPDKRFQSADDFIATLDRCKADAAAGVTARTGVFARVIDSPSRHWYIAGLILAIAIGLSGYFLATAMNANDEIIAADAPVDPVANPPVTAETVQEPAVQMDDAILDSTPSGAEIFEGEIRLGITPFATRLAPNTFREVEVRREGFEPVTHLLRVGRHVVDLRPLGASETQTQTQVEVTTEMRPRMRRTPRDSTETMESSTDSSPMHMRFN